jgi:hypothetical protein
MVGRQGKVEATARTRWPSFYRRFARINRVLDQRFCRRRAKTGTFV